MINLLREGDNIGQLTTDLETEVANSLVKLKTGLDAIPTDAPLFLHVKKDLGLSPSFEFPKEMMNLMIKNGLNASEAALKTKLTQNNYVGHAEGTIGILTKGRINRKDQIKPAIVTALIHLENPELY